MDGSDIEKAMTQGAIDTFSIILKGCTELPLSLSLSLSVSLHSIIGGDGMLRANVIDLSSQNHIS